MDGSRFDAWTRRRFGAAAVGLAVGCLGLGSLTDRTAVGNNRNASSKHRRKKKKRRRGEVNPACEPLRSRCNPHNTRELCCNGLACGVVADLDGNRCCRLRYGECASDGDCCNNLRCRGSEVKFCDLSPV
jgi:hypothetical protein